MKDSQYRCRVLSFAFGAVLSVVSTVRSADLVWTNLAGGNWNGASNWSPNQVPGVFDHAWVTNNGTYAVMLTGDFAAGGLALGSASGTNTLGGTNALVLLGPLVWQGGAISNALFCLSGGQITGSANKYLTGGRLLNSGVMTLGDQLYTGNGSVISNAPAGTFDITANYGTTYTSNGARGVLYNAGLLRKTGGTGTARLDDSFTNAGTLETRSGTLRLTASNCSQIAGFTRLLSGGLQVDQGYTLWGGMLSGSNTLTGNLDNESVVSPSESSWTNPGPSAAQPAHLTIAGNYVQVNGALVLEVGGTTPGTDSDLMEVTGTATLGGTLDIVLRDGFTPAANSSSDVYTIFTGLAINGCFAALNRPSGWAWLLQYVGSVLVLTMVNTAPVPAYVPDQTIPALQSFDLTLRATDPDVPAQNLTWGYSSWGAPGEPTNWTVSAAGQFHWTPTAAQIGITNHVRLYVMDDGPGNCPEPMYAHTSGEVCTVCAPNGLSAPLSFNLVVTAPASPPRLSLQSTSTNVFLLSWLAPADGWLLERTNVLNGSTNPWPQVPPPYQTNNDVIFVNFTNVPPVANQFFRLHKP